MENKTDILNELQALSPTVARIKEMEVLDAAPSDYFSTFSSVLMDKIEISTELNALSKEVAAIRYKEIQPEIPQNYFENFASKWLLQNEENTSLIPTLPKEEIAVPSGYFDTLAETVLHKIKTEEQVQKPAKVIPMQSNKTIKLFTRFAVAASLVGVLVWSVKNILNNRIAPPCEDGIACLTQDEIYDYLHNNSADFELHQIQEAVAPTIEKSTIAPAIEQKDIENYIEQNNSDLLEDASTDIF